LLLLLLLLLHHHHQTDEKTKAFLLFCRTFARTETKLNLKLLCCDARGTASKERMAERKRERTRGRHLRGGGRFTPCRLTGWLALLANAKVQATQHNVAKERK
jgi:hypothetical protein